MKAIRFTKYGSPDVLQIKEVERPVPKEGEVLVKVHAASVNALDWHLMRGSPFLVRIGGNGLGKPKDQRLGVDLAGRVEAVGSQVTRFQVGNEVFGRGSGAFAEYACAREDAVMVKPDTMTFEAAAAVPVAALTALQGLRNKGQIQPGHHVLIQGASGGVGTFAVQIAKAFGAEVTAVCSTRNVDQARSLGADHVIDYTRKDFTRGGQRYDLILAVNGFRSIFAYRRALRPGGSYVMVGASNAQLTRAMIQTMVLGPMLAKSGRRHMGILMMTAIPQADLALISELIEGGKIVPVIERCYPFHETAEALRHFDRGHAKGKLVITV